MTPPAPRPASEMTTDEIVADIRARISAAGDRATPLQVVAGDLAAQIRDRLPYLDPADIGAVMANIGAWLTHAGELFTGYGMKPALVAQTSANVVAIAAEQLYGTADRT